MRHLRLLAALVLVAGLCPTPAWATPPNWSIEASATGADCGGSISSGRRCYYAFTDGTDSVVKTITAEYATFCFDPNLASSGAATAQVRVMAVKDTSSNQAAGSVNTSEPVINATLTGAAGDDCIYEVPRGRYWIDVTTPSGGETAVVTVDGA